MILNINFFSFCAKGLFVEVLDYKQEEIFKIRDTHTCHLSKFTEDLEQLVADYKTKVLKHDSSLEKPTVRTIKAGNKLIDWFRKYLKINTKLDIKTSKRTFSARRVFWPKAPDYPRAQCVL